MDKSKHRLAWWAVGLLAVAAIMTWWLLRPVGVPEGFAASNGRIEATEADITDKIAGCIDAILVRENQLVREDEVLAKMDTRVLQEQRLKAVARIREIQNAVTVAQTLLKRRQSETRAAQSLVNQRQAELDSVVRRHTRSCLLTHRGTTSAQQLDDDRVATESTRTALESVEAQVLTSKAATEAARINVTQAQTHVETAQAIERRIAADIGDNELKVPRDEHVQYRATEPGEVLAAGGRALSMVDLSDVYIALFLPAEQAGTLKLGSETRLILDTTPDLHTPATISFVTSVTQFTPETVETSDKRLKLMSCVKARIPSELLQQYLEYAKTGLSGVAWVQANEELPWPGGPAVRLPQ